MLLRDAHYRTNPSLAAPQKLRVRLAVLFVLSFVLLALAAYAASRTLVQSRRFEESFQYQTESARRQLAEIEQMLMSAQSLAVSLAAVAQLREAPAALLGAADAQGRPDGLVAAGLWPLPQAEDAPRHSRYWIRRADGYERLDDYNDPRTVPYWREKWFTPARLTPPGRCYWTPAYRDPLLQRELVSCATPVLREGRLWGVATVSLDRARVGARLQRVAAGDPGYSLLLDRDGRVLGAAQALAAHSGLPDNLADLAKREPALAPLALRLHALNEAWLREAATSPRYDASAVSALREATHEMTRTEAESALISLWSDRGGVPPLIERIEHDPLLGDASFAVVLRLPQSQWLLARVAGADEGLSAARYIVAQSLLVSLGAVAGCLILVFAGLRRYVFDRLTRIAARLDETAGGGDGRGPLIEDSGRDEIGLIAHWANERLGQIRELDEQLATGRSALIAETEARRTEQHQRIAGEARLAQILGAVHDAVVVTDLAGRIVDMSLRAQELTRLDSRQAIGRPFDEIFGFVTRERQEPLRNLALRAIQTNDDLECPEPVLLPGAGEARAFWLKGTPLCSREGRIDGAAIVFRPADGDVAASAAAPPAAALNDGSRTACDRLLRRLQESAQLVPRVHAFIYIDVDNLDAINAGAGLQAGNEALDHVWNVLSAQPNRPETTFRLGADQFGVVLEDCDAEHAVDVAEALRAAVALAPLRWERRDIEITVSAGVTSFGGGGSPFDVIKRAEDACHAAKAAGRNQVRRFDPSMQRGHTVQDEQLWLQRLQRGLEQDYFHLTTQWIQPMSGAGGAYEILLALEDEEGFWAAAQQFMPIAEQHRLGRQVDAWVIDHAVALLSQRLPQLPGLDFCGVNLSPESLDAPETLDRIVGALQAHPQIPPQSLLFEVREDAVAENPVAAAHLFEALRKLGCKTALDRFVGRRGADLALMRALPLDYVKIGAQQFRRIAGDAVERMVAESVLRLARTLKLRTIVTGIDDPAALGAWKALGADYCQGNLIAKPTPLVFSSPKR